jgi:hypothetical protein
MGCLSGGRLRRTVDSPAFASGRPAFKSTRRLFAGLSGCNSGPFVRAGASSHGRSERLSSRWYEEVG